VDPKEFLDTASSLVCSSTQPDLRTSVSRSYYAVILFFRDYLAQKVGFLPEKLESGVHKFVPECFSESGSDEAKTIGEKIKRACADRVNADYKLSKQLSKTKAGDCLDLASKLISTSLSFKAEKAVLKQATARAKARKLIN
jgi:uncharacterized protein (UPF0332 family)